MVPFVSFMSVRRWTFYIRKKNCNKADLPDSDPSPFLIGPFSPKKVRSSMRLPGRLPLSIMEASLVARRIRSGRLVRLPLASAARTASMSRRGGLLMLERRFGGRDGSVASAASPKPELAIPMATGVASGPRAVWLVVAGVVSGDGLAVGKDLDELVDAST